MGRNSKPLSIGVIGLHLESLPITRFKDKGHFVGDATLHEAEYDVIIGPRCWRIDPRIKLGDDSTPEESLERQLEMMEKGVRAIKYPKEKKDAASK